MDRSVIELVAAARARSSEAYDELVRRFGSMATQTAHGWLRDEAMAQDVAQEAFAEAFANLAMLVSPAAFPGFLRRIVLKHCDRVTRRVGDRELLSGPLQAEGRIDPSESTEGQYVEREAHARVRAAIAWLPPHERIVVSLHYLAELKQHEVASWLGLPLTTVKKRLHSARKRLQSLIEEERAELLQPAPFAAGIRFFISIREGWLDTVDSILREDPSLVDSTECWDIEVCRQYGLPSANGGTPLVRAAELNRVEMVELLLRHGSQVEDACRYPDGETPLWAATAAGSLEACDLLLRHGADPNCTAGQGRLSPLHVAAMRGRVEIARLLLQSGANPNGRDRHDWTPSDWARCRGHAELAALLDVPAARAATVTAPSSAETRGETTDGESDVFETGIKAIDLFAPIQRGSLVYTQIQVPHYRQMILGAELSWRLPGGGRDADVPSAVWMGWERRSSDRRLMDVAFSAFGVREAVVPAFIPFSESDVERRKGALRAVETCRRLHDSGTQDVLLVALATRQWWPEIEAILPRRDFADGCSLTCLVIDVEPDSPPNQASPPWTDPPVPYDAQIIFRPGLSSAHQLPEIDPLASTSKALVADVLDDQHLAVARAARAALASDQPASAHERFVETDRSSCRRAQRLRQYLQQPLFVAEPYTGVPGSFVKRARMVEDVRQLLE